MGKIKTKAKQALVAPSNSKESVQSECPFRSCTVPNMVPPNVENSSAKNAKSSCRHCENMAKNFLYLESLIRSNCKKDHCSICSSTLKFLSYVNQSIRPMFKDFNPVVKAVNAFAKAGSEERKTKNKSKKKSEKLKKKDLSTVLSMKINHRIRRAEGGTNPSASKNSRIKVLKPVYCSSKIKRHIVENPNIKKPPKAHYIIVKKTIPSMPKKKPSSKVSDHKTKAKKSNKTQQTTHKKSKKPEASSIVSKPGKK